MLVESAMTLVHEPPSPVEPSSGSAGSGFSSSSAMGRGSSCSRLTKVSCEALVFSVDAPGDRRALLLSVASRFVVEKEEEDAMVGAATWCKVSSCESICGRYFGAGRFEECLAKITNHMSLIGQM